MNNVTIAIPAHNNAKVIGDTLRSALAQTHRKTEILVIDDASTDNTAAVVKGFPGVRLIVNEKNLGIGRNIQKLMNEAEGKYVIYMCADDVFASTRVVDDIVQVFHQQPEVGVVGRFFYFFMDGKPGAIGVCRDKNILTQSCCPSGMAFRKMRGVEVSNKIFVEMPTMVAWYLKHWNWTMLEYDVFAARFHPGGNTGTKKSYYTESPTQNWIDLVGSDFKDFPMFVQLKNRAPHLVWREICLAVRTDRKVLKDPSFYGYASIAVLFPGFVLRPFSSFYRNRIARLSAKIIERPENV